MNFSSELLSIKANDSVEATNSRLLSFTSFWNSGRLILVVQRKKFELSFQGITIQNFQF